MTTRQHTEAPQNDFRVIDDRLARIKAATRGLEVAALGGPLTGCRFELEFPRAIIDQMSDEQVYQALATDGADVLMTAFLRAKSISLPRGGEGSIECKADSKGNVECKGSISIRF